MVSDLAHKVAGTFIPFRRIEYSNVLAWTLRECLQGRLSEAVQEFCAEQVESLDPARVEILALTPEAIECRIPCRVADHESNRTFLHEVRFALNPATGACLRKDLV